MKNTRTITKRRALTAVAAGLAVFLGVTQTAQAQDVVPRSLRVIGLTDDGRLVQFKANSPRNTKDLGSVQGLRGNDAFLVGIDFRVQNGKLYGVSNSGGVYTIDPATAQATFVNALTVPLNGTSFGVDFNPAADRLRIISDQGQNLAHNVNPGGVTVDNGTLTYAAPPAAPVVALGLTGAAYTNNDFNQPATGTTLFDVDTTLDQIVIQSPPGNGILVATGKLGVDADAVAGFDIYSQLKTGVTASNHAFAALLAGGSWGFYRIELTTGNAVRLGTLGDSVVDIAIILSQ